jgi:starch-binding outer membrane protein, SusD/RagB family
MKNIFLLLLGLGLALGSCQKFLEEVPNASINADAKLSSYAAGVALADGTYRTLPDWIWPGAGDGYTGSLTGSREFQTGKAYSMFAQILLWKFESDAASGDMDYFWRDWDLWYRGVRDCNLAIQMLPGVSGLTSTDVSRLLGEVRTLRAWYYFCLVRYFGDVVYNTANLTDVNLAARPRTSLKTIYDKIIVPDLEFAVNESALPDTKSSDGHVTKYVAKTILADVYLTMAGYPYQEVTASADTAKQWCVEGLWTMSDYPVNSASAIDLLQKAKTQLDFLYGKYSLGTYDDLHNPAMDNKGEAIFQAQFQAGIRNNGIIPLALPQGSQCSVFAAEQGTYVPSKKYYDSYNPADKRIQERQMFFTTDTKAKKFDPNESPIPKFGVPHLYKFYDYDCVKNTAQSSLNWTFYRYADVLLLLTEVNWSLKQLGQAIPDADIVKGINEVRTRALLPSYMASDLSLLNIMSERAYELVFENKMLWDQRRTRKALIDGIGEFSGIENLVGHQPSNFTFEFTAKHLLSPISSTEIDNNRTCLQNFGWSPKQKGQN